jgi:hypothetical protein
VAEGERRDGVRRRGRGRWRRRRGAGRIRKGEQRGGLGIEFAALVETAAGAGVHWKVALAALVVRWPSVPPAAGVGGRWRDGSEFGRRGRFGVFWVGSLGQAKGQGWSPVNRSRYQDTLLRFLCHPFGLGPRVRRRHVSDYGSGVKPSLQCLDHPAVAEAAHCIVTHLPLLSLSPVDLL